MKTLLRWAGAWTLACLFACLFACVPEEALAQSVPGAPIKAPAGYLPGVATYCDDGTGHAVICASGGGGGGGGAATPTGPAGTPNSQVVSVQGVSGGLAIPTMIGGNLPGFISPPTVNLGTLGGAATAAKQDALLNALGSPFQAGGLIGNASFGAAGTVVSGDQAYTAGSQQLLNLTPSGRLKVGLSSAGNIAPAAKLATTTTADLVGCQYLAAPPGWSDTWTGSIGCDAAGNLRTTQANAPARDGNGDLRVPTVTVTPFYVSLAANTSTELLGPSATRIGYELQCAGSAAVAISRIHATLTSAIPSAGGADWVIPAGTNAAYIPAYVSGLGVTAYTGTAQACWGVAYARQ